MSDDFKEEEDKVVEPDSLEEIDVPTGEDGEGGLPTNEEDNDSNFNLYDAGLDENGGYSF